MSRSNSPGSRARFRSARNILWPMHLRSSILPTCRATYDSLDTFWVFGLLRNILADVLILTLCQLVDVVLEDHFPVAQHEKTHGDVAVLAFRQRPHLICLLVELMSCHGESVLQAMGHQQRAGLMDIPLFHDQFDDGIGSDGIEAAGG